MPNNLDTILKPQSGKHLGDLCGWSLHGEHNQSHVKQITAQCGLQDDLEFPKVGANSAYRRAVNKAVKGAKQDEKQYNAILLEDTADKIVHAIVKQDVVDGDENDNMSDRGLEFLTEVKVGFDKKKFKEGFANEDLLQLENDHVIAQRIKYNYEQLAVKFLTQDVRIAFQRAFEKWSAIRLLDHGGLWWVPAPNSDKVRKWKELMEALGYTAIIIPVFDTEETIKSLQEQSKTTLEGQLDEIMNELESFSNNETTRSSTLEKRVEKFETLRNKIELHANVLGFKQQELLDKLDNSAKGLARSLGMPA